jgi:diguanylate cyclase (GGDEF)-like protein/PAS domain S-box-containing protein
MKPVKPVETVALRVVRDTSQEIAELIEALHRTGQRLEELTGGEVDTVANREGRSFMLQHAQDRLRLSDAAKQVAILNALPAHIALLDARGVIVSVNEAWRRSGSSYGLITPGHMVGADYLAICEAAVGEGSVEAHEAAVGIRSVLAGSEDRFSMEYACHSPSERHWFLMLVTRLSEDQPKGVVVMHMDVTTERLSIESLHESESRFRQMAENIRDVFFLRDVASGRMLYISPAYEEIWGRSVASVYENPGSWMDLIHPDDIAGVREKHRAGMVAGGFELEYRIVRADDTMRRIASRGFPVRDANGVLVRIAGIAEDITERRAAEERIAYLNRVYAVMSGINTSIVLVRDRQELYRQVCTVAVHEGGFRMAWVALVDAATGKVSLVASEGVDVVLLEAVQMGMATQWSASDGQSMVTHAVRDKKAFIANHLQRDAVSGFGPKHAAAGVYSMVVLPLIVDEMVAGVLTLGASEADFFHREEMNLLEELAGHIAYAIEHIDKQERLNYLAYYDVLTGLANRSLFLERAAQSMRAAVSGAHKLALFIIDLERFRNINDSLGRSAGDALLKLVGDFLVRMTGDASMVARVGADQFAIVLPKVLADGDVAHLIEHNISLFMAHPFRLNDAVFRIAGKVGVAIFPEDGASADSLYRHAEAALKKAKASGDRFLFYTQGMSETAAGKLTLENRLRQALDKGEFVLHYQPKVSLDTGKLTGAEALIRWNDPRAGLVAPGRFIPVLEETGLIHDVGRWAMRQALDDYLRWRNAGLAAVRIAVNVSPLQLRDRGFIAEVKEVIGVDPLGAAGLEIEITESVIMEDVKHSIASLQAIRALGITVAIDDFGTGFSSLSYLSKLPVDTLKIDRSFVIDMTAAPEGLALVSTIISLAHSLRLKVVAEGVETEEQSRLLRLLKCDEMQGFLFSKPVPGAIFEKRYLLPVATG